MKTLRLESIRPALLMSIGPMPAGGGRTADPGKAAALVLVLFPLLLLLPLRSRDDDKNFCHIFFFLPLLLLLMSSPSPIAPAPAPAVGGSGGCFLVFSPSAVVAVCGVVPLEQAAPAPARAGGRVLPALAAFFASFLRSLASCARRVRSPWFHLI